MSRITTSISRALAALVLLCAGCASPDLFATSESPLESSGSGTDFGTVEVGTTSGPLTLTLTNEHHKKTITVDRVTIDAPFSVSGPTPRDLAPGESVAFEVRFTPTAPGDASETLTASVLRDKDLSVSFTGFGIDPTCVAESCGEEDAGTTPDGGTDGGSDGGVVEAQVSSPLDDAEENAVTGETYLDSSDLELTEDDYAGGPEQIVGMRFELLVPRGATVHAASLQLTADEADDGSSALRIHAQAADDAAPFTEADFDISSRATTSAGVDWAPPAWNDVGAAGDAQRTPDLAAVIQEVVDRAGWDYGNHIALLVSGNGTRTAESFDGDPEAAPRLVVDYSGGDPLPVCGDGVCGGGESCSSCATDCGDCCGDLVCDTSVGESCDSCASDCGSCETTPPPSDLAPNRVVDPTSGSDANDGSPASPWRTLTHAAGAAAPGDVVGIVEGTYTEGLHVNVSGAPGARIVYMAHPDNTAPVILDGRCVEIEQQSHIEIRGLRIQFCDGVGDHDSQGVYVEGTSSGAPVEDIVIAGNHFYSTRSSAISLWGVRGGADPGDFQRIRGVLIEDNVIERAVEGGYNEQITLGNGVTHFEIRYNELKNRTYEGVGGEGIDLKEGISYGSIHHNLIHGINERGIYIDGGGYWVDEPNPADNLYEIAATHHIDVYANVVYDVPNAFAIMSEHGGDVHDIRVYDNLFYDVSYDCAFIYDHPYTADDVGNPPGEFWNIAFVNNTFWGCSRNGLDLNTSHLSSTTVSNNIMSTYRDRFSSATEQANLVGGDPGFVDPAADDYHLRSSSPGVDRGVATGAPAVDLEGVPRPQGSGFDIGAYER